MMSAARGMIDMGMFDDVHFKMDCPVCGEKLSGFQTKDANCELEMIEPDGLCHFYSSCKCGAWIDFRRPSLPPAPLRAIPLSLDEITAMGFAREVRNAKPPPEIPL